MIVDASLPLMADQPPKNGETIGTITIALNVVQTNPKQWNSQLHGGEGQTVGWSDAHASFERRPDIGYSQDNIFTNNAGSPSQTGAAPAPTAFVSGTSASTSGTVSSYTSGGSTQVKVDTDGSGTSYTQIATLSGVTGLNLNDLITDGNLIVHHT